ncbi:cyclase family protein [Christensenellaceae bacterium OttesenSCG-928-L17]|nr:cyclase family protein [Christensenellaceae bacterium OttesenSCG-928-L17]
MNIIDLTHTIAEGMPVYPGTEPPLLEGANTYAQDGFRETRLTLYSHTGTHMDAPAHIFEERPTLDALQVDRFAGKALVVDCTDLRTGGRVSMERIARPLADEADFLLFRFGYDAHWNTDAYFEDYPCISEEVAQYMIESGKKGIGVDVIGIDPIADRMMPLHKKLLARDMVIVENLCNLDAVGSGLFMFLALPLKFSNSDGAPVRAIAMVDDEA